MQKLHKDLETLKKRLGSGVPGGNKKLSGLEFTIFLIIPSGLISLSTVDTPSIATGQTVEPPAIPKIDFNGDGYSDLAIGVPGESVGTVANAGAVNVIYGSSDGLRATALSPGNGRDNQIWTQNSADINGDGSEDSDLFGWAVATGDFNKDGYSDLAIGVENEAVGTIAGAGAVNVIYGSSEGLRATPLSPVNGEDNQIWTQNSADVVDDAEPNDGFGAALTTGDFNNDTFSDLAIGVPREDGTSGAVNVIYGSSEGLIAIGAPPHNGRINQIWTQNSADVVDNAEPNDRFGSALTTGDFNKDGISDLAIGVPGEGVGTIANAGATNVIYGTSEGLNSTALSPGNGSSNQIWTQNSTDVEDDAEAGDSLGSALATGDFNKDGISDLATGVHFEGVGTIERAGAVNVIYGSSDGLRATALLTGNGRDNQIWSQNSPDIEGDPNRNEYFGSALSTGDFNNDTISDLAIGVPNDWDTSVNALPGSVNVIYGSAVGFTIITGGLSATVPPAGFGRDDQIWSQNSADIQEDPETGDGFGFSLADGSKQFFQPGF